MPLLRNVTRFALRKGILDGSRPWLYTGVAAASLRLVRRVVRESPRTVLSEELKPGEGLEIRVVPRRGD